MIVRLALLLGPFAAYAGPPSRTPNAPPECLPSVTVEAAHGARQVRVYASDLCTDPDGDRLVVERVVTPEGEVPVRGRHFTHLHLDPDTPPQFTISVRDTFYSRDVNVNVVEENTPPRCPDLDTVGSNEVVDLDTLGFSDEDGDELTYSAVQIIDPTGAEMQFAREPGSEVTLPSLPAHLDTLGLAQGRLNVLVEDGHGGETTCSFTVAPPDELACLQSLERTVYDASRPFVLDPSHDCIALAGSPDRLGVAAIQAASGEDVPWHLDDAGRPNVSVPAGETTLEVVTHGGDVLTYEVHATDALPPLAGKTTTIAEDGGTLELQPLVDVIARDIGREDDPLAPVEVELIGPDLTTVARSDSPDAFTVEDVPTAEQGLLTVLPRLVLKVRNEDGKVYERSFAVPVDLAPRCRASGTAPTEDGWVFVPHSWCLDPEGGELEVVSLMDETGAELPFENVEGGIQFLESNTEPLRFTLSIRDTWSNLSRSATCCSGTFTITSRDEFGVW